MGKLEAKVERPFLFSGIVYNEGSVLCDILNLSMSALDWMMKAYPEVKEREDLRRIIGRYGLTGAQQVFHNTS